MSEAVQRHLQTVIERCEQEIRDLTQARAKAKTKAKAKHSKKKPNHSKSKSKHCSNPNPLYSLKHCLHVINDKTSKLDSSYVDCLLGAKSDNGVRHCFQSLQDDLEELLASYHQDCNITGCQVGDISNQEVECCVDASSLGELNSCFNKMIMGPLAGNLGKKPSV